MANNLPAAQLETLPKAAVKATVCTLRELYELGRPADDDALEERISQFFKVCEAGSLRPGVETLAMALHTSRQSVWNWSHGLKCSKQRQEAIQAALSFINAALEQLHMTGHINPASGIFLLKNWCGYRDSYTIEPQLPNNQQPDMTPEEIQRQLEQDIPIDDDIPID